MVVSSNRSVGRSPFKRDRSAIARPEETNPMKKLALSLTFTFATAGLAFAQAPAPAETKPEDTAKAAPKAAIKTHKLEAEVVNPDLEKKILTFKHDGTEKSAPVGALAMYRLKRIKAGDKVTLTCKEGDVPADCKEITFIKAAADPAAPPPSKPQ
jgi:hypothetical protein